MNSISSHSLLSVSYYMLNVEIRKQKINFVKQPLMYFSGWNLVFKNHILKALRDKYNKEELDAQYKLSQDLIEDELKNFYFL